MRHRLVVPIVVLAIVAAGGCSRKKGDRPDPQAQAPAPAVTSAGNSVGPSSPATGGSTPGKTQGDTSQAPDAPATDPAGKAVGSAQSLPTGTTVSADGVGPYTIGQEQASLTANQLLGPVKNGSDGCDTGRGQAKWGSPTLIFSKGKLQHLQIGSRTVGTAANIKVGATETSVRHAYPQGSALSSSGHTAWYAPSGDFALLFRLTAGKVATIEAGPSSTLQFTFTSNTGC